jgi:glycosyltransferase involved in cell wall biosynthesis
MAYEVLAEAFDVHMVWISPPPANDPIPPSLGDKIDSTVVDGSPDVLTPRDVRRNIALFRTIVRLARGRDLVIASTSDSWKARVVYAAARVAGVPVGFRKEKWRDKNLPLRGARAVYWSVQRWLTDYIERHAAGVLVGGTAAEHYLVERGMPRERISQFRDLHIDTATRPIDQAAVANLRRLKRDRIAFLYIGRIIPRKGLATLISAFRRVDPDGHRAVLFAVGDPIRVHDGRGDISTDYYDDCVRRADNATNVIFLPSAPPERVQDYYAAADVFVHPHEAQVDGVDVYEGWGVVVTEAASMAKPIIASDRVASARDVVIDGDNGFLVSSERLEDGLATAMRRFVESPELLARCSDRSRRRFEQFLDPAVNIASVNKLIARRV